jgi:putative peptidoglycan lipid II flippase
MISFFRSLLQKKDKVGGWQNLLFHTAFALTVTSGLSYALGLVRDKTFAYQFGASSELDIYNAAFVIPDFFLALVVTGALSAAFVPIFSGLHRQSRTEAIRYTNQMLSHCLVALAAFCALFGIFLPYFAQFLVPGFSPEDTALYIHVTRLMLISPFIFTVSNTFGNVLLNTKAFWWYGMSPVMYNIGIIIGVFSFAPHWGVKGLVLGTLLGALLHLSVRLPSMWRYGYRFKFDLGVDGEFKQTVRLIGPKMVQIGMWQILMWWFVRLASQLPEGNVTIYSFARNFQSVPVSLVGIAIALAAFAELSNRASHHAYDSFRKLVVQKSIWITVCTGLSAIALAVLSRPIINTLLGGGKFDETAVNATAAMLVVYAFSIPLESLMHLFSRAHYALKDTLRASLIQIVAIGITMGVSQALLGEFELFAIPIAFAVGLLVQVVFMALSLHLLLKRKLQPLA